MQHLTKPNWEVTLVASRLTHVGPIATRMRRCDRIECEAYGLTPKAALRRSMQASSLCLTALVGGRPEAMMGVEVRSAIEGLGAPWMLATDAAYRHGQDLLTLGPRVIAAMSGLAPHLSNLVGRDNPRAVRMLRAWGFDVGDQVTMIGGVAFLTFSKDVIQTT